MRDAPEHIGPSELVLLYIYHFSLQLRVIPLKPFGI